MRGFAGLLVAAAFALVAFHSLALQRSVFVSQGEQLQAGLKVSQLRAVEDDVQLSFQAVLYKAGARETDLKERARKVVFALAEWEKIQQEKYAAQGIALDAWFGTISSLEKSSLPVEMLEEKKALKCAACTDLSEVSLQAQNSNVSTSLLAVEQKLREIVSGSFSKTNSSHALELPSVGAGWSIYIEREGVASVQTGGLQP